MVGQREEAALGVMAAGLISLAAQQPAVRGRRRPAARFYVLDGTRPDAPEAGFWHRLAPRAAARDQVALGPRRAELLDGIAAELARRQQEAPRAAAAALFAHLQPGPVPRPAQGRRLQLRRLATTASRASPAKQFATILRDGPAVGIHTLVWCDSYSTLNRLLDRQGLRDLECACCSR